MAATAICPSPTIANDVLRGVRRIFDDGVKHEVVEMTPASTFDRSNAGGKEEARKRWLTRTELQTVFGAMRRARGGALSSAI